MSEPELWKWLWRYFFVGSIFGFIIGAMVMFFIGVMPHLRPRR